MGNFIYRGPLRADSKLFKGREPELDKLIKLCSGAEQGYAIIYGGRQTGKTSLLYRVINLFPDSICTCLINFQGTNFGTTSQALKYITQCINQSFPTIQILSDVGDLVEMESFLQGVIKEIAPRRLIFMMDELGALPSAPRRDLANLMRAIFTKRILPAYQPLSQLGFVLTGSIELHELVVAPLMEVSPLNNICEEIYLPDLSRIESVNLIVDGMADLNIPDDIAERIGELVFENVSGHPYLTQRLGGKLEEKIATKLTLSKDDLDEAINELRINDAFLLHLHNKVKQLSLESVCQILLDTNVSFTRHDREMTQLELIGLAKRNEMDNTWIIRNALFGEEVRKWSLRGGAPSTAAPSLQGDMKVLKATIVRIFANAGAPVGVGFLVGDRQILTCAHVAGAALGIANPIPELPQGEIYLDWPLLASGQKQIARIAIWKPLSSNVPVDMAVLELVEPPPSNSHSTTLVYADNLWEHSFRVFGFPERHDIGVWTSGVIREENAAGWLQIEDTKEPGFAVKPGFSGSPVWDNIVNGVVGMVVAAEAGSLVKVGYIIPSALLRDALSK